jgi:hypothetical protein
MNLINRSTKHRNCDSARIKTATVRTRVNTVRQTADDNYSLLRQAKSRIVSYLLTIFCTAPTADYRDSARARLTIW